MTTKRSIVKVAVVSVMMTMLTACSFEGEQKVSEENTSFNPVDFSIGSDTVSKKDEHIWKFQRENEQTVESTESVDYTEKTDGYDSTEHVGELVLDGNDKSSDWKVDGDDIIYANRRYHELNLSVQKAQSPYDKNTMINFILKMYEAKENEIYTNFVDYSSTNTDEEIENEEGAENTNATIDELLSNSAKYLELKEKYNDSATWVIEICTYGGKNKAEIIGCKSFTCLVNTDEDVVIDMNNDATSSNESQDDNEQQQQDTTEEDTNNTGEEQDTNNTGEEQDNENEGEE